MKMLHLGSPNSKLDLKGLFRIADAFGSLSVKFIYFQMRVLLQYGSLVPQRCNNG